MFGLSPVATELRTSLEVRFVPTGDISGELLSRRGVSIAVEAFRNPMRPNAWSWNAQMIGQNDDGALGIEQTDHIVKVGDTAAPVRDIAQIATECEQLGALGVVQESIDVRIPAETIVNWSAVVGCAGDEGQLQCCS